ncbi:antitoxin [Deinococcus detaillensis]|uniref:Antitoxin n=1 Tax=Deinococcus detaillensis TaxID=2592048 RepID=A0A553UPR5_9DEIO|nr:antitoxin [Deinococcus detaillensis]TSA82165.1 antitoxin [Deinococcus detaillensis]
MSLEQPLLDFLVQYQESHQVRSKSEVVARAIMLLRDQSLEAQYAQALTEWDESGEAEVWDVAVSDGLEGHDAAR